MRNLLLLAAAFQAAWLGSSAGALLAEGESATALKSNLDLPFEAGGDGDDDRIEICCVEIYGQQSEGDGFFFCCDISGSMKEEGKLKKLQQEVIKNVTRFSDQVQFSIVLFDAGLKKFPATAGPADATPTMKAAACGFVLSIQAGQHTCPLPALLTSLAYAGQSTARRKVIIYLSDGRNTCPGNDEVRYGQQVLEEVARRNVQRVKINTICIGTSNINEEWMKMLAVQNHGQASRAP